MIKTQIVLHRVGERFLNRTQDVLVEFETIDNPDKELIRKALIQNIGINVIDSKSVNEYDHYENSFTDESGNVEFRFYSRAV